MKKVISMLIITALTLAFTGCGDISVSKDFNTYKLRYLVNLSNTEEAAQDSAVNEIVDLVKKRVKKFNVKDVKVSSEEENGNKYVIAEFGTIDKLEEIRGHIEVYNSFLFKEAVEPVEDFETEMKNKAQETLDKILAGESFAVVGQNEMHIDRERIVYDKGFEMNSDAILAALGEILFNAEPGVHPEVITHQQKLNPLAPPTTIHTLVNLIEKKEVEKTLKEERLVEVSHILIAYQGATRAAEDIELGKEEAKALADELKGKLDNGEDFATLAKQFSDDLSNKEAGGVLEVPAGNGIYVPVFEEAALALEEEGQVSDVVESPFGFHIIKVNRVIPEKEETYMDEVVTFEVIFFVGKVGEFIATDLNEEHISNVEIRYDEEYEPYLLVNFNPEGTALLKTITENNEGKIIGVFNGKFSYLKYTVKEINDSGQIRINYPTSTEDAEDIKENILLKKYPAPIIFDQELDT